LEGFPQGERGFGDWKLTFQVDIVDRFFVVPDIPPLCPFVISADKGMARVQSCQKYVPGRCAHRRSGIKLCKLLTLPGQFIDVGSLYLFLSIAAQISVSEIVSEDEDDVGRCGRTGFLGVT